MDLDELEEALEDLLPDGFSIETDSHGRIVIHTKLRKDEDGELIPLDHEDDDPDEDLVDSKDDED